MSFSVKRHNLPNRKKISLSFSDFDCDREKVLDFIGDWFSFRRRPFEVATPGGSRGVLLDYDEDNYLKIKGAGLNGGEIDSTVTHCSGPPFCIFDFEGKRMIDLSFGHDNAPRGGMSFTQAYFEFLMAGQLGKIVSTIPCIGWGKIEHANQPPSWFSVHLWSKHILRPRAWRRLHPERGLDRALFEESITRMLDFHFLHGIIGFSDCAADCRDGRIYSFDLHPHRFMSPMASSAITMTCSLAWALTIKRLSLVLELGREVARDIMFFNYKRLCPSLASVRDVEAHELWAQQDLAGLTENGGVTIPKSWKPAYQHGIDRVLADITANPISEAIYRRFSETYPNPAQD